LASKIRSFAIYASGVGLGFQNFSKHFSDATVEEELALMHQVIATVQDRQAPSPKVIQELLNKVVERVKKRGLGNSDLALLDEPQTVSEDQYGRFCEARKIVQQEVGALAPAEAAAVFRAMLRR
jgi:hypothetical protein